MNRIGLYVLYDFGHILVKFFGATYNEIWVLFSHGIMTSFSHHEFTHSLITQTFTLSLVDFVYTCNMDVYDTNIDSLAKLSL